MKKKYPAGVAGLKCDKQPRPGRAEIQDNAHLVDLNPFSHLHVSPGTFCIGDEWCTWQRKQPAARKEGLGGSTQHGGHQGSVGGAPVQLNTHLLSTTHGLGAEYRVHEAQQGLAGPSPSWTAGPLRRGDR